MPPSPLGALLGYARSEALTLPAGHEARIARSGAKGLSARQIDDAMGHKKTSTTEIYIQRFNGEQADERIREAMSG